MNRLLIVGVLLLSTVPLYAQTPHPNTAMSALGQKRTFPRETAGWIFTTVSSPTVGSNLGARCKRDRQMGSNPSRNLSDPPSRNLPDPSRT